MDFTTRQFDATIPSPHLDTVMNTDFWQNLSGPLVDQIRTQMGIRKRTREALSQLHQTECEAEEKIKELRGQICLRNLEHWLGRMHWKFESSHTGFREAKPFVVLLVDEDHLDHNQKAVEELHYLLGFGYHDNAKLIDGVQVQVDDGEVRLKIETAMLNNFISTAGLQVFWGELDDSIATLERGLMSTSKSLDELRTLKFIADEAG